MGRKRKIRSELTQDRLKELAEYSAETGELIRYDGVPGSFNSKGYPQITIDGMTYPVHRLAWLYMTGEWPKHQIDHKNRVKTDNAFLNLREATQSQNMINGGKSKRNKSGYRGVSWHSKYQKWRACISINGKLIHLGYTETAEDAHSLYINAGRIHFGEFFDCS